MVLRCRFYGMHAMLEADSTGAAVSPSLYEDGECESALRPWLTRRSVGPRHLGEPGPSEAQLRLLLAAAANAPDHLRLRPCRLRVLDTGTRIELGLAFQEYRRRCASDCSEDDLQLEMQRALAAPCMIAVGARIRSDIDAVPPCEQWIAVGAVLGNLMAAAHALGFAGKLLSGSRIRDSRIAALLCAAGEEPVGFVYLGTPLSVGPR